MAGVLAAAGVPVYKLLGQKHRSWVPIAAWTVSTHPRRMANTVRKLAELGYTWMKYHLSPLENVIDQMNAMQAVAPPGFRIHHDFTMGGTDDHVFELLEKISQFPIAGCFEDPLPERDLHAAFKAATLHFNTDTETWSDDVVRERLEPVNGWIRVPERPGLGVTLDWEALDRLKQLRLPAAPRWIIRTRFANGRTLYNLADPRDPLFMVRPDKRRLVTLSYNAPVTTDYWDPDDSPEFRQMMQRLEQEGMVVE